MQTIRLTNVSHLVLVFALVLGLGAGPTKSEPPTTKPSVDRFGDPLPTGALHRLGTTRFRHGGRIGAVAFLPGNKALFSGACDETIRIWDVASGRELRKMPVSLGGARSCDWAFAVAGKLVAAAGTDRVVTLWDVTTGKPVLRLGPFEGDPLTALAADGKTLLVFGEDVIRIWDIPSGRQVRQLKNIDASNPFHLAVSPDGTLLAWSGQNGVIHLWDLANGKVRHELEAHAAALAFAPDGKTLASVGNKPGSTLLLWEVATGKQLRRLSGPRRLLKLLRSRNPSAVCFSGDGKLLAASFYHGNNPESTIVLWDANTPDALRWIDSANVERCLALSGDHKTVAAGGDDGTVRLWDTQTGKEIRRSSEQQGGLLTLAYSPDGKTLASGSMDGTIRLWNPLTGELRPRVDGRGDWVSRVVFSPNGANLATAHDAGTLRLWDPATGKELRRLPGFESWSHRYALDFSPTGGLLAATNLFGNGIQVREMATGKLHRFDDEGNVFAFLPDGRTLVSISTTSPEANGARINTIRLRDLATAKVIREWTTPQQLADAIAISPGGRFLAVGGAAAQDGVRVWETANGKERAIFPRLAKGGVSALAFSPDTRTLAVGLFDSVRLWEMATGKERGRFDNRPLLGRLIVFAPDGKTLASGGSDSTVLIWDLVALMAQETSRRLSRDQLKMLWQDLAHADAARAHAAMCTLSAAPEHSVPFLREHLRPAGAVDAKHLARLIADLGSSAFRERERATNELERLDDKAEPTLRRALAQASSLEVRRRLQKLLQRLEGPVVAPEQLRNLRAVEALERIATPAAQQLLGTLAQGDPEARLTKDANQSLSRLQRGSRFR